MHSIQTDQAIMEISRKILFLESQFDELTIGLQCSVDICLIHSHFWLKGAMMQRMVD